MGRSFASLLCPAACGVAGLVLAAGSADAAEITSPRDAARCAVYGPGFSAVAGSDTCIRIGGRVRVESGTGRFVPNSGWADNAVVPAATDDAPEPRRHLRLTDINTAPLNPLAR